MEPPPRQAPASHDLHSASSYAEVQIPLPQDDRQFASSSLASPFADGRTIGHLPQDGRNASDSFAAAYREGYNAGAPPVSSFSAPFADGQTIGVVHGSQMPPEVHGLPRSAAGQSFPAVHIDYGPGPGIQVSQSFGGRGIGSRDHNSFCPAAIGAPPASFPGRQLPPQPPNARKERSPT